jgi:hypothetical protein
LSGTTEIFPPCSCDFDFKAKPVFGGSANNIEGVVKRAGEPVFKLKGKWDETVTLTKLADKSSSVLFENNAPLHARRLTRRIVPLKHQKPYTEEAQVCCLRPFDDERASGSWQHVGPL